MGWVCISGYYQWPDQSLAAYQGYKPAGLQCGRHRLAHQGLHEPAVWNRPRPRPTLQYRGSIPLSLPIPARPCPSLPIPACAGIQAKPLRSTVARGSTPHSIVRPVPMNHPAIPCTVWGGWDVELVPSDTAQEALPGPTPLVASRRDAHCAIPARWAHWTLFSAGNSA